MFSKIGLFDDALNFAEDWEFYLRFLSQFDIAVLPEHLANYHFRTRSGLYGNTVTNSLDSHIVVAAGIRNNLIRRDISSGKFGLGSLIALSSSSPLGVNVKHELWIVVHRMIAVLESENADPTHSECPEIVITWPGLRGHLPHSIVARGVSAGRYRKAGMCK